MGRCRPCWRRCRRRRCGLRRQDEVDPAAREQRAGSALRYDGVRDPGAFGFPRREPRALEQRPRLADPQVTEPAGPVCCEGDGQRGALAGGDQPTGIAVSEDPAADRDQRYADVDERPCWRPSAAASSRAAPSGAAGSPPAARNAATAYRTPPARFTAVGRADASAAACAPTSSPRAAARATPYAPAMPSSGAPRTASRRIASTSAGTSRQVISTSSAGSRVWSSRTTAGPLGSQRSGTTVTALRSHGYRPTRRGVR